MKQLTPRNFERTRFLGEASVRTLPAGAAFRGEMLDLGQGGMGLFSSRFLQVGQSVEVALHIDRQQVPNSVGKRDGRVVAVKVLPEGNILGIAFARPLTDEELQTITENRR